MWVNIKNYKVLDEEIFINDTLNRLVLFEKQLINAMR